MDKYQYTKESYNEWSKKMTQKTWNMRYSGAYLVSKFLVDYALLLQVDFRDKKVLNVGCAEPIDEAYFMSRVSEWCAVDINESIIEASKKLLQNELSESLNKKLKFHVENASQLSFPDQCFDIVVSFSVIDHIPEAENRRKAVDEMCRVLKTGGHLVLTVPNRWDWRRTYICRKKQKRGEFPHGYEYQFSPLELKRMIKDNGLKIIDRASTEFNPVSNICRFLRLTGLQRVFMYFGERFGYLARK